MQNYYAQKLSAERLRRCYEIAPARVKQYLDAEIEFVLERIKSSDRVLELGCGYGRILLKLAAKSKKLFGVDTSIESLLMAQEYMAGVSVGYLLQMNAAQLGFCDRQFDLVICIQNGISAIKENPGDLIKEAVRVTRHEGTVLFSSYSDRFWDARLEWFEIQSRHGLIGEIDFNATGNGVIVCKDGFKATTVRLHDFMAWMAGLKLTPEIFEVDDSSIFYEINID